MKATIINRFVREVKKRKLVIHIPGEEHSKTETNDGAKALRQEDAWPAKRSL